MADGAVEWSNGRSEKGLSGALISRFSTGGSAKGALKNKQAIENGQGGRRRGILRTKTIDTEGLAWPNLHTGKALRISQHVRAQREIIAVGRFGVALRFVDPFPLGPTSGPTGRYVQAFQGRNSPVKRLHRDSGQAGRVSPLARDAGRVQMKRSICAIDGARQLAGALSPSGDSTARALLVSAG